MRVITSPEAAVVLTVSIHAIPLCVRVYVCVCVCCDCRLVATSWVSRPQPIPADGMQTLSPSVANCLALGN